MSNLKISAELSLPVDVAGEAIGILAKRGAGKTNTAIVLVEEMVDAGVQVVVLDPVGVWWGVRAGADGSRKGGLAIPVIGGAHGDVALEPAAGQLIADVVVDSGQSIVIDLSEFSKTQQRTFVAAFATRLYARKAKDRTLTHVVLEEADEFAPQRVTAGDAPMVGAIAQLVKRGRSRGLGLTFVTQRSASLNKDVLDQADVLIAMRTGGPRDRKAIEGWIEHQDAAGVDDVLPSLPGLDTGEAWIWNPERSILERVQIRRRRTFDSSATPKAGQARVEPKETASIDLAALGQKIAETAERAKANDPAELRRQIRELEGKASNLEGKINLLERATENREQEQVIVEVPVLTDEMMERLVDAVEPAAEALISIQRLVREFADISTQLAGIKTGHRPATRLVAEREGSERFAGGAQVPSPRASRQRVAPSAAVSDDQASRSATGLTKREGVSGPQQRILDALAWFEEIGVTAPRRSPLAAVAGASPKSSGFEKNVSTLRTLGLIDYPEGGRLQLTDEGRTASNPPPAVPTITELHDAVCRMVSGPQATLLRVLIHTYPRALSREALAERAGASVLSSGFEKNVSTLKSFELITYPARGEVVALPVLFP